MTVSADTRGHDFSDRINPFIVKELRQGLRGRIYLTLFLVLVGLLAIQALVTLDESTAAGSDHSFRDGLFRFIMGLAVAVLLPLNTLGAIHEERRGRKIELVMLTRVSARGVVLGKWLTFAMQSVTLSCIIAPFIVLRYFSGGVNFFDELCFLGTMMLAGLVFGAATLCASAFIREGMPVISFIVRAVLICGGVVIGLMMIGDMHSALRYHRVEMYQPMLLALATFVIVTPVLLEIAASKLAPEAINHEGVIRTMAVVGSVVLSGCVFLFSKYAVTSGPHAVFAGVMTGSVYAIAVAAFTLFGTRIRGPEYATPADRFGAPGRWFGRVFLTPGWVSGFAFSLLLALVTVPLARISTPVSVSNSNDAQPWLFIAQLWAALIWPLFILCPLVSKPATRFAGWLVLQTLALLLALMIQSGHGYLSVGVCIIPTTGLCLFDSVRSTGPALMLLGVAGTFAAIIVTYVGAVIRERKRGKV